MKDKSVSKLKIVIVDDHELILQGTISAIQSHFVAPEIYTAKYATAGIDLVQEVNPDLILMDLSMPQILGGTAYTEYGLQLLQYVIEHYPDLNITVQSSFLKAIVRLSLEIENHPGGFTIADKSSSIETLLKRLDWSIQGVHYTQDIQRDLQVRPEWIEVLKLAFEEGLQDKMIAQTMHRSERMIGHYWSKIRDVLGIYPEADKNMRTLTYIEAKKAGLID
jgi:DNA-binding NarL/FixJ family response regulator